MQVLRSVYDDRNGQKVQKMEGMSKMLREGEIECGITYGIT